MLVHCNHCEKQVVIYEEGGEIICSECDEKICDASDIEVTIKDKEEED